MPYFEINVSLNGQHLFATAEHSITTPWKAFEVTRLFREKFPVKEGYQITVTEWGRTGHDVTDDFRGE